MTPYAQQLYNDIGFWYKRLSKQQDYMMEINMRSQRCNERWCEIMISAVDVMSVIQKRIIELENGRAER